MPEPSAHPAAAATQGTGRRSALPRQDPAWVRPTLIFLFGVLVGALAIAGSNPVPPPSPSSSSTSVGNIECDHVAADSQHVTDLASRARTAAQRQDSTTLAALASELEDAESALMSDLPSCHR